ncbi:DUF2493 domain-containing protein [Amycolatopsis sp. NPDC059657]|uniref:DUF2493 domain-containing protein n=1 Tax=Amycolatopsis sp. NPDC059657 TaxID=3346899 RepID=UPI00366FADAA
MSEQPQRAVARVLVTGSRTWTDTAVIRDVLAEMWRRYPGAVLVTGGCPRGADRLAEDCWAHWGGQVERHPADWNLGRAAGFLRNQAMVDAGADHCVAFIHANSRGATHCAASSRAAGIPTTVHRTDCLERTYP